MVYEELIDILRNESNPNVLDYIDDATTAINELLARAKSVEAASDRMKARRK